MLRFNCDYLEGCHPAILDALVQTNMEQTSGYGLDPHCEHAAQLVRRKRLVESARRGDGGDAALICRNGRARPVPAVSAQDEIARSVIFDALLRGALSAVGSAYIFEHILRRQKYGIAVFVRRNKRELGCRKIIRA